MSEDTGADTWPALLAVLDVERSSLEGNAPEVTDLPKFRDAFEVLCNEHKEHFQTKLLNNLLRQFNNILAFVKEVDTFPGVKASGSTLLASFWAFAYAAIQAYFNLAGPGVGKLSNFLEVLRDLNKIVPSFGADLSRHNSVETVQRPLVHLFEEYIDCYKTMISYFATAPPPLEFNPVYDRFSSATTLFQQTKEEFDRALEEAEANERPQEPPIASVPSYPHGPGNEQLQPYPTSTHFERVRHLGEGTYGEVAEVREATTGNVYARKLIRYRSNTRSQAVVEEEVKNEVAIMQKLRHHHIAPLLFWVRELNAFSIFMLPVADTDLRRFLEDDCGNFESAVITLLDTWFGCLISALNYAHGESIAHHDIKPQNILIKNNQPFLADFGSARDFTELETSTSPEEDYTGTPVFWPPEPRPWGRKADIFALGCVFSEMLTVRSKLELQDYRNARRVPNSDYPFAFRANMVTVKEWVTNLQEREGMNDALQIVIEQTLKMLGDKGQRPDARIVKRRFRVMEEMLFCTSC